MESELRAHRLEIDAGKALELDAEDDADKEERHESGHESLGQHRPRGDDVIESMPTAGNACELLDALWIPRQVERHVHFRRERRMSIEPRVARAVGGSASSLGASRRTKQDLCP